MLLFQEGVLILDQDACVLFADPAVGEILELKSLPLGNKLTEISPEPALARFLTESLGRSELQETEIVTSELEQQKTLALSLRPCHIESKALQGWVLLIREVSALRRLESIERDFITNVSHELRTPLTSIKMAAESLQLGAIANEKFKERFLSNIQREADRLTRLVNELIVLSNVHDAKTALHLSTFELEELLADVLSTMQHHARVNDIELKNEFAEHLPIMSADRDRLSQVLINLIDNAIKCNRPNGSVSLTAQADTQNVTLTVTDTGIGIPSIDLPKIFDRFFRVDKARSRVTGGTGLGLSLVKDIVEAHGGSIEVESTINVGTTFTIHLPIRAKVEDS